MITSECAELNDVHPLAKVNITAFHHDSVLYPQIEKWAVCNIYFHEKLGYVKIGEIEDGDAQLIA